MSKVSKENRKREINMGIFFIIFYILLWFTWPRETIILTITVLGLIAVFYALVIGIALLGWWILYFVVLISVGTILSVKLNKKKLLTNS